MDLVILGAGIAGLSAAIYAHRFNLKTAIIGEAPGGTIAQTHLVENYPGFESLSGFALAQKIQKHTESLGVKIIQSRITDLQKIQSEKNQPEFLVQLSNGQSVQARAVIFATGTLHRRLNIPGEKELENKGVSFCATCDAPFFRDKKVAVIGGSDSAVKESLILAEHAREVFIIYRREKLRAEPINIKRALQNSKIKILFQTELREICGQEKVEKVILNSGEELVLDGVFVEIGRLPRSELAQKIGVQCSAEGEILTNERLATNIAGVFAAGDVRAGSFKQAISAAAEGSRAAAEVFEFIQD